MLNPDPEMKASDKLLHIGKVLFTLNCITAIYTLLVCLALNGVYLLGGTSVGLVYIFGLAWWAQPLTGLLGIAGIVVSNTLYKSANRLSVCLLLISVSSLALHLVAWHFLNSLHI